MGKRMDVLTDELSEFIAAQKIFFVATAAAEGSINLSPKGMDSLRVLSPSRIVWLNMTGSGNETATHLQEQDRITLMWCAFEGKPLILRTYGHARVIHPRDADWSALYSMFPSTHGARQIIDVSIALVQTSCGFGIPLMDYQEDRTILLDWAEKKGPEGISDYWAEKNTRSLDGKATGIFEVKS